MSSDAKKNICMMLLILIIGIAVLMVQGCNNTVTTKAGTDDTTDAVTTGVLDETAADGIIDFEVLIGENPDIYAWLYIPDTDIDYPVVRANISDDYYISHTADGASGSKGAVYTQIYNSMDFSDFNTVIHAPDEEDDALFYPLHMYGDREYFDAHRTMYIVTPYTTLTYEIIAAYEDDGSDIIRRYDYTTYSGCNRWITDYISHKDMLMVKAEPAIEMSVDTSFLVTLAGNVDEVNNKQYVVIASMLNSGSIELTRYVSDTDDYYDGRDITGAGDNNDT